MHDVQSLSRHGFAQQQDPLPSLFIKCDLIVFTHMESRAQVSMGPLPYNQILNTDSQLELYHIPHKTNSSEFHLPLHCSCQGGVVNVNTVTQQLFYMPKDFEPGLKRETKSCFSFPSQLKKISASFVPHLSASAHGSSSWIDSCHGCSRALGRADLKNISIVLCL